MKFFCILALSPSTQPQPGTSTGEPRPHSDASGAENPNKLGYVEADAADSTAARDAATSGDSATSGDAGAHATCTARAGTVVPAAPQRFVSTAPATAGRDTPAE